MEITSEFKTTLKKSYKSIKKGITTFLKKLGFSKKKSYDVSDQIVNEIHGTIGRYLQREINQQVEPRPLQQGSTRNNTESFDRTSGLPSYREVTINSRPSNRDSGLPSYREATGNLPTYEDAVADIKPFDEKHAWRYKEMLKEVNNFFAQEALVRTSKNLASGPKNGGSLAQPRGGRNSTEDTEESELYSL